MEVVLRDKENAITFGDLELGDCFRMAGFDGSVYMKGVVTSKINLYVRINLTSGFVIETPSETEVVKVRGAFVEEFNVSKGE